MCENVFFCVIVNPRELLTQAEGPVKCFIFRCVKLLHFPLTLSLQGHPSAQSNSTENERKHTKTTQRGVTPPAAWKESSKWDSKDHSPEKHNSYCV